MSYIGEKKRVYQLGWIQKRRQAWLDENGPCKQCGSSDRLEVDHIDPTTKEYNPSHIWSRNPDVRRKELAKCQVLCYECHKTKTRSEVALENYHGTITGYSSYRCRCSECRNAHRIGKAEYRRRTGKR